MSRPGRRPALREPGLREKGTNAEREAPPLILSAAESARRQAEAARDRLRDRPLLLWQPEADPNSP